MSKSKSELTKDGPFPNHIDPWLEKGHYFHQLHGQMIAYLLEQLQEPLNELGYFIGREASIQISQTKPDLFVHRDLPKPTANRNYEAVAARFSLDAGITFKSADEPEIDRLFVESVETGRVVTVIELISPGNKTDDEKILRYQNRRQLLLNNAIDVVEIDLTRSVKHLITDEVARNYPYHVAVHLYDNDPRFIGLALTEALKTFVLPLEAQGIPVDLQIAYQRAYKQLVLARQMLSRGHYTAQNLPFPTTLSDTEREKLMLALEAWKEQVK